MKKYLLTAVIPLLLFVMGIGLTFVEIYGNEGSFVSIKTAIPRSQLQFSTSKLKKGDIISGLFISKYNNLGTIAVRFTTHYRINEDSLIFRIRDQDSQKWFYEHTYKTDQFQPNQLFPFGFPIIANSKGRAYVFELESIAGSEENAVSINTQYPIAISSYSLDKHYYSSWLKRSPDGKRHLNTLVLQDTLLFIFNKTISSVTLSGYTTTFLLYLSPIPIYFFWYWLINRLGSQGKEFISKNRIILLVISSLTLTRMFIIKNNADFYNLLIVLSWVGGVIFYNSSQTLKPRSFIARHPSFSLIIPALIIVKALFIKTNPDFITMSIVLLWYTAIVMYKIKNVINIYLSLIFLTITVIFYLVGVSVIAEQAAAWTIVSFGFAVFYDLYSRIRGVYSGK